MKNTNVNIGMELTLMSQAPSEYTIRSLRGAITVYASNNNKEFRVGNRVDEETAKSLARDYNVNVTEPKKQ